MSAGILLKYFAKEAYDLVAQDYNTGWRFYPNV